MSMPPQSPQGGFPKPPVPMAGGQGQAGGQAAAGNFTVLVFVKSLAAPVVLYSDNPPGLYEKIKKIMQAANKATPKLIEEPGMGPLKKVCLLDVEISGVALQSIDQPQGGGGPMGPMGPGR